VFAYLACEQGRPVLREELAEAVWGEALPATWEKALTVLVSKLRGLLAEFGIDGASALVGASGCYRLELPEGSWIDVLAATDAAQEAEEALAVGDFEEATRAAAGAESLTRQLFLAGESGNWVEERRRALADVRGRALTALADASLRVGNSREAVNSAKQVIALEPFREAGYRLLMEGHVAGGNRAEALRVYERCRRFLAEELGAYPSPETEALYRRLLESAPARGPGATPGGRSQTTGEGRRVSGRWALAGIGVALAAIAAIVVGVVAATGGGSRTPVAPNAIVALDASGSIAATVPVGARPVAVASAPGSLWVANLDDRSVTRVNVASRRALRSIPIAGAPTALAATSSAVWVIDSSGRLSRLDQEYDRPSVTRQLIAASSTGRGTVWPMLAAFGSIWIVSPDGYVLRFDPGLRRKLGSVDVGNEPSAIAAGAGSLWVTNSADGTVTRIDPATLLASTVPTGHGPVAVAVSPAGVWIANAGDDAVVRIDPETDAVVGTTGVGDGPAAVLATPTATWVANSRDGTVMRLDPHSGKLMKTIHLGGTPTALAYSAGRVWVALAPAPPPSAVAGGIAHLAMQNDFASLDPPLALQDTPEIFYTTCANLVTYPDKPAPDGSQIVPEVAEAVPAPTNAGRTYTFTIRPGFRFSPPSNAAVTAQTFKSTIERVADPRLKSPLASEFSSIIGYRDYVTGETDGLRGVTARGNTLTIRLAQPDGALLANLAGGAACAVPSGTPAVPGGLDDIPSAGPYYIASYTPRQQLVLERNPNYHGDRPHHLDKLVFEIGINSSRALEEIETGKADYAVDGLPRDAGPSLELRYGPHSKAARQGHQQYFINPANGMRLLHMNTSRPLFANTRLRRAVSYAIDRAALVGQGRRFAEVNPFNAGAPTDDYMPTTIAGRTDFHLYPLNGPDLMRAKRLAGHVHARAIMYTPSFPPWLQEAQIIRRDLKPLGIDVQIKTFPFDDFFARISRRGEPFDLAVSGYAFDTTDPAQVLELFDGRTIHTNNNTNFSYFDDPAFDRQLAAAAKLSGASRYRTYSRLEHELERNLAPAAAFATNASRDFFSARMGCQLYQPNYGIDLAALCLRR
jgi:ABC-type transport system substrate-binding protein/DNA-binding SARP family transcriptional activator